MADGIWRAPIIQNPSAEEFQQISDELGLHCTSEELEAMLEHASTTLSSYGRLTQLPEPTPPVKYPRTSGYRPPAEENPYNAWYWKCDIKGADSGKLSGKMIGVKDNVCVAGVPMMNGSRVLEGYTPDIDATVVTRILDAGGRIVGKTNCEDLCFSGASFTCVNGPVRNPHDTTRNAGGSSSGSAVAVVTKEADMAIGGDQGGSIRIPSSWTGIVGLKPTYGLVPYTGAMPIEFTMDHLGPMARTVSDCALLLEVMAGYDEGRDSRQRCDLTVPEYSKLLNAGIQGKKIALVTEGFDICTEEDVKQCVSSAASCLKNAGATVETISIPEHKDGPVVWSSALLHGTYVGMIKGNGNAFHYKGYHPTSLQEAIRRGYIAKSNEMSPLLKLLCLTGEYINRKCGNWIYTKGQNLVMWLTEVYDKALANYDVLIMPTLPTKATKLPDKDASTHAKFDIALSMIGNTAPFDATGHPALTINTGHSEGLPVGMMIIGRRHDDLTVLQVARAYEKIRDGEP